MNIFELEGEEFDRALDKIINELSKENNRKDFLKELNDGDIKERQLG